MRVVLGLTRCGCVRSNIFYVYQAVDASLIPTISFPAFATHEEVLSSETKANVVRKLRGQYGFKRFGRDGFRTAVEDPKRRYYHKGETKVKGNAFHTRASSSFFLFFTKLNFTFQEFESIECEWPLFFIFMIIDGVFKSQPEQVEEYQNLLRPRIRLDNNGGNAIVFLRFFEKLDLS